VFKYKFNVLIASAFYGMLWSNILFDKPLKTDIVFSFMSGCGCRRQTPDMEGGRVYRIRSGGQATQGGPPH
jgi:hypothetical protein